MSELISHASESVSAGHPDKVCDQVAAAILDQAIEASTSVGRRPRVAMEVSAKGRPEGGTLMLFGEVTLPEGVKLDYEEIARKTVAGIGYSDQNSQFHSGLQELLIRITQQSANIDHGVSGQRTGAGDQGIMFGGAVDETPELMPMPIAIAQALTNRYTELYRGEFNWLRPDAKSQVVLNYANGYPVGVNRIIIAASHTANFSLADLRPALIKELILPVLDVYGMRITDPAEQIIINGAGEWTIFGPLADAGTTNRKIIVDSYGGAFPHGGGGLNGKDPTKVDLAGAVGARYIAKALVAEKLARKAQVEISYVIGRPDPLSVNINTFGTANRPDKLIYERAQEILDLSVDGIIDRLDLFNPKRVKYQQAAVGGFFGRREFPWEQIENVNL
ncbi:MAG: methionine adenosyltransferase [Candidatus Beckwithbacteria bacterium]|nr:methionine adenosyltransferase [Candidatus Beckwithbacteria bacterium]